MRTPLTKSTDLRKSYHIRLELGLILSLLIFVLLFNIDFYPQDKEELPVISEREEVVIDEVIQTKQKEIAPPPPKPLVPVTVPNDEVISDEILDIDAELDLYESAEIPIKPPAQEATEESEEEEPEVFVVVEQMPVLIGGLKKLQEEISYPQLAKEAGIQGRVIVEFIIDEEGNVTNPRVIRGIGGGCDEEALRVVSKAKFIPGKQRGRPVKIKYALPVVFVLRNNS